MGGHQPHQQGKPDGPTFKPKTWAISNIKGDHNYVDIKEVIKGTGNKKAERHRVRASMLERQRRLIAPETELLAAPVSMFPVLILIVLALLSLVYYVIRRMRSRAPRKALSDRVTAKHSACPCRRRPVKQRAIVPLRNVIVVRITETKPKGGCKSPPSYPTVGRYYARSSP